MSEALKLDALAIGAHPDDVEFSCGGTLIKLASLGYRVGVLDMARGELGTRGTGEIRDNLELPDGHIWLTEDSRVKMVRKIRLYRPTVIFTHYWEDPHPDHVHTCQIVREAAHVAGLEKYDAEGGQQRFRPQTVGHFMFPRTVPPTFVVDISRFVEQKQKSVASYRSQLYDPHSKEPETALSSEAFLRRLEAKQRFFGSLIGVDSAEAFVVREALNVHDPIELLSRRMNMYS